MSTTNKMTMFSMNRGSSNTCACDCPIGRHMVVHPINTCQTKGEPSIFICCDCDHCTCECHN